MTRDLSTDVGTRDPLEAERRAPKDKDKTQDNNQGSSGSTDGVPACGTNQPRAQNLKTVEGDPAFLGFS